MQLLVCFVELVLRLVEFSLQRNDLVRLLVDEFGGLRLLFDELVHLLLAIADGILKALALFVSCVDFGACIGDLDLHLTQELVLALDGRLFLFE